MSSAERDGFIFASQSISPLFPFLTLFHWKELPVVCSSNPQEIRRNRGTRNRGKKQKSNEHLNPNVLITLTVNGPNTLIQRQRLPEWIKIHDPIMLSMRNSTT